MSEKVKVYEIGIDELLPDPTNANKGSLRGQKMIDDSIAKTGLHRGVAVDANGYVVAGNKTQQAAIDAGFKKALVVETDGDTLVVTKRRDFNLLSDDPNNIARQAAYYDNRSSEVSLTWDAEVLLSDLNSGLDLSNIFDQSELDALLDGLVEKEPVQDAGAQIDKAAELQAKWGTSLGQIWQLGRHRLICGVCTDKATVDRLMQGEKADAVVTDPPYGQNQAGVTNDEPEKLKGIIDGCVKNLPCDNAVIVAFSSPRTFIVWLDAIRANGFNFERMLWMYKAAQETFPWRGWLLKSEAIMVSSIGKGQWQDVHPYSHDCYYKSEVSGQLDESLGWHGSVKPLDVVIDLVARVSAKGQIVYEPFSGSGTTLMACESLGRQCRAIDIDASFVAITLQRYQDSTGQTPVLL